MYSIHSSKILPLPKSAYQTKIDLLVDELAIAELDYLNLNNNDHKFAFFLGAGHFFQVILPLLKELNLNYLITEYAFNLDWLQNTITSPADFNYQDEAQKLKAFICKVWSKLSNYHSANLRKKEDKVKPDFYAQYT